MKVLLEMVPLKNICVRITKGTTPTTLGMPFTDFGVNFIKAEALNGDPTLNSGGFSCISESTHHALRRSILTEADVLVTIAGANIGKCGLVKKEHLPANTNQAVGIIRVNSELADPRYVYYHFKQEKMFSFIQSLNAQAAQPNINLASLGGIKIPLPPLPTQKKIAGILSAYDDAIENNLRALKLLEEMAQITYEEWFVRLRFPGHKSTPINEATGLPEGWSTIPFGNKYKTASGGTPSRRKEDLYFKDGIIPWIRTQELRNNLIIEPLVRITEVGLKNSSAKIFPANTVLLAMYGNTIGETALLRIAASTNQACCAFLSQEYESYFIYQYLMRNKSLVLGYRMGAAQENISQEIIKSIKVLNPTDEIIRSYANLVRPIYDSIENFMRQNQRLREARDILLPRLMTGVIDAEKYQPENLLKEIA